MGALLGGESHQAPSPVLKTEIILHGQLPLEARSLEGLVSLQILGNWEDLQSPEGIIQMGVYEVAAYSHDQQHDRSDESPEEAVTFTFGLDRQHRRRVREGGLHGRVTHGWGGEDQCWKKAKEYAELSTVARGII